MNAKQLYDLVYQKKEEQVKNMAIRIKNAKNPSVEITHCIDDLVRKAYQRCVEEMEHDKVLEYSINISLKVVDYSLLKQMGVALTVIKNINKVNRNACNYGEPYYKASIVGLSKISVKVTIKKRFGLFTK